MLLPRLPSVLSRTAFAALLLGTPTPAQAPCHDLSAVTTIAQQLLAAYPAQASSCLGYEQAGQQLYQQTFGTFTLGQVVPIASATKTLSAAVLMSLVDSGTLHLDDRVGQWLPEWNTGLKATITLRMCFTHTAGMIEMHPLIGDDTITLRQAAAGLAAVPLVSVPGSRFAYGGASMHVAGAVCEVASGIPYGQLFQQRIAQPLGMTVTDYLGIGTAGNPRIAGGARSNLQDFQRFMRMLRQRGAFGATQVLSTASVDTMLSDQTSTIPIGSTPHPDLAPYGIGIWLDRRDSAGRTVAASAVGAFGFAGWVDRAHDGSGVFVIDFWNQTSWPYLQRMWDAIDDAVLPAGVTCVGQGSPGCASGSWLNGKSAASGGNVDFALRASRAPAGLPGVLVLGDPLPSGLPFADLVAHVGPQFAVVASLIADVDGRASVPVPLSPPLVGAVVGVQAVWLTPLGCTALGLQASHAVRITVLP
jgi:CubicO group peptidase (beta-lactamase class C family)